MLSTLLLIFLLMLLGAVLLVIYLANSPPNEDISITIEKTNNTESIETEFPPLKLPNINNRMRYHVYKVKGKNPSTNHQKTCIVVAKEGTSEELIAKKSGYLEPFTITLDMDAKSESLPSERQLDYARALNIPIPSPCSSGDLSRLISRQLGEMTGDLVSNGLLEVAGEAGVCLSPYTNVADGVSATIYHLRGKDLLIFFSYLVYCVINNVTVESPNTSAYKNVFCKFADKYIDNIQFQETISSFTYDHIQYLLSKKKVDGRSTQKALVFKTTFDYLSENIPMEKL